MKKYFMILMSLFLILGFSSTAAFASGDDNGHDKDGYHDKYKKDDDDKYKDDDDDKYKDDDDYDRNHKYHKHGKKYHKHGKKHYDDRYHKHGKKHDKKNYKKHRNHGKH